jgi:small subunit ribosomal protein S17
MVNSQIVIKVRTNDIGIDAKRPKASCTSALCPWHGYLRVRGKVFTGKVLLERACLTAVVGWDYLRRVVKYERFMRKRTRLSVHNPTCIDAKVGDVVKIFECRPLSKTKRFVIVEKVA